MRPASKSLLLRIANTIPPTAMRLQQQTVRRIEQTRWRMGLHVGVEEVETGGVEYGSDEYGSDMVLWKVRENNVQR